MVVIEKGTLVQWYVLSSCDDICIAWCCLQQTTRV